MELAITAANAKLLCESQGLAVNPANAKAAASAILHSAISNYQHELEVAALKPPTIEPIT